MSSDLSGKAVRRLGDRLVASVQPSVDDLNELQAFILSHEPAMRMAEQHLLGLGLTATSRGKSTGTLIEKLRRGGNLHNVQDVAGARIVLAGGRSAQDAAVVAICESFADLGQPAKVVDRRDAPSAGYRAVHVIVKVGSRFVEIQVRTELQDRWAQMLESMGDRWGRGIRYGEPIPSASKFAQEKTALLDSMQRMSTLIADFERNLQKGEGNAAALAELEATVDKIPAELASLREKAQHDLVGFRARQSESDASKQQLRAGVMDVLGQAETAFERLG